MCPTLTATCRFVWAVKTKCIYEVCCVQRLTTRARGEESTRMTPRNDRERQRDRIVRRAALEFHDGMYGTYELTL